MIDSYYHVTINGVNYRLSESTEGQHYNLRREPLRPPNASVVQGDNTSFQLRPDVVVWKLDDWSGGAGQLKFDPQNPNRWWELFGVDPFSQPGNLLPGYELTTLYDASTGTTVLNADIMFAWWVADTASNLHDLFIIADNVLFKYTGTTSGGRNSTNSGTAITGLDDASAIAAVVFDGEQIFYTQAGNNTLYRSADPFTAATVVETGAILPTGATHIIELGPYVYTIEDTDATLYESAKTGTGDPVALVSETLIGAQSFHLATLGGKIYLAAASADTSSIWEVIPSSAAGPGYGRELAYIPGVVAESLWTSGGLLFFNSDTKVYYLQPDGSYGTIGDVEFATFSLNHLTGQLSGSRTATADAHYMAAQHFGIESLKGSSGNEVAGVVVADVISGGMAVVGWTREALWSADDQSPTSIGVLPIPPSSMTGLPVVMIGDDDGLTPPRIAGVLSGAPFYGVAVSPWYDFGLNTEKVLAAIRINYSPWVTPLMADTVIVIDVQVNQDDDTDWIEDVVTIIADDTETYYVVSASGGGNSIEFEAIRFRVRVEYQSGVNRSSQPIIRNIELYAQALSSVRVWDLILDLSDDKGNDNVTGTTKITNLLASSGEVVAFVDGYRNRDGGSTETASVIIDAVDINLDRPGEGFGRVVLREVS